MKPALMADEWKTLERGGAYIRDDGKLGILGRTPESVFEGETRHTLAALALHGESFGFTRNDAEALEFLFIVAASCLANHAVNFSPAAAEKIIQAKDAIARLDALLAPEDSVFRDRAG